LTGGSDNVITTSITTKRDFSVNNAYFSAIPYEFLRMAAPLPTIALTYNSIPAICLDCVYQYQSTSPLSVTAATFKNGKTGLSITLASTDPSALTSFAVGDITVTIYGQPCTIDSGSTTTSISCTFNTISCGGSSVPNIPAGNEAPQVHIRQVGFVSSSILLNNNLVITSVTPTTLGVNGGVVVTASGTGFPLSSSGSPSLSITADNIAVTGSITVTSLSNCQAQFTFPPQSFNTDKTTTLTYLLTYAASSYTYADTANTFTLSPSLDPSVTALSTQSASPILKQSIVITGSNFEGILDMKVYLYFASNLTQKYELAIRSVTGTTSITALLGGGRSGDYYLRVLVIGKGMSAITNANKFSYQIVVSSIAPVTGSIGGGYIMTINGANFATAPGSTQVFIGDGINSLCLITSITTATIQCTVPTMHSSYNMGDSKRVLVTGRLIEESVCIGTCSFTY
jgi:hypothetical protein